MLSVPGSSSGGGQLRWYRFSDQIWYRVAHFVVLLGLFAAGLIAQAASRGGRWPEAALGALLAAAAVWVLAAGLRSGIGAGAGGVTVRSALGRGRLVPWRDVAGFQAIRAPLWDLSPRGTRAVAVVCADGRLLTTAGCYYVRWTKKSGNARLTDMLRALEAERAAATPQAPSAVPGIPPTGLADW
jgi:hypothetical protein